MNHCRQFVYRVGLIGITNILLSFSGIILLPIITKNISINEYGIFVQIDAAIGMFPGILTLGLPYSMVRYLPSAKDEAEIQERFYSILSIITVTCLVYSILTYAYSAEIASLLFEDNIKVVKITSVIIFFECLNNFLFNFYRASEKIKRHSILSICQVLINVFLVSYFVIIERNIYGALVGILLKAIIINMIMIADIILEIGIKVPTFEYIKSDFNFGIPSVPGYISTWIVNSSDRYIISILLGSSFVGYYSPGYTLGNMITLFIAPLFFLLPMITSKYYDKKDFGEVKKILSYSLKYYLMITIPASFGISLLSKNILQILTTVQIAEESYMIAPLVALSMIFYGSFVIIQQIIIMDKKTKVIGKIWILSSVINILLNFLLIPLIGILGAAIATAISFLLSLILISYFSFKIFTFNIDFKFIFKSIYSSIIMSSILILINPKEIFEIIFAIIISSVIYFITMLVCKGFGKNELSFFEDIPSVKNFLYLKGLKGENKWLKKF